MPDPGKQNFRSSTFMWDVQIHAHRTKNLYKSVIKSQLGPPENLVLI